MCLYARAAFGLPLWGVLGVLMTFPRSLGKVMQGKALGQLMLPVGMGNAAYVNNNGAGSVPMLAISHMAWEMLRSIYCANL